MRRVGLGMSYLPGRLVSELQAAGLPVTGANSDGVITWGTPPTPEQEATAQTVLAAHDPTPAPDHRSQAREVWLAHRKKQNPSTAVELAAIRDVLDMIL